MGTSWVAQPPRHPAPLCMAPTIPQVNWAFLGGWAALGWAWPASKQSAFLSAHGEIREKEYSLPF